MVTCNRHGNNARHSMGEYIHNENRHPRRLHVRRTGFRGTRQIHACVHVGDEATNILPGGCFQPVSQVGPSQTDKPEQSHEAGPHVSIARRRTLLAAVGAIGARTLKRRDSAYARLCSPGAMGAAGQSQLQPRRQSRLMVLRLMQLLP
ncbi:hypothetical protein HPB50_012274 [Hyalomma asiaticum]|uniref:Uncharacterized protein n=1 Tax=Hyalomma asiaticum TaxID=266040 RepID=A0ACB7SAT7_HYAAI|nr:hypothetical protein HPB50_012274 [Hyalomma asiaticum]